MSESSFSYDIHLDATHFIYQAHFPGNPITPGVCIIQIAKELMEEHFQRQLRIQKVQNVKFLNVISPIETPDIVCSYTKISADPIAQTCKAQVQFLSGETLMGKLSFICKINGR
ncbi:MAG: hydroxymyristoyl-ACP dehydratase [Prevotella sp.]|nr:hydroxymyristoyl-ACP dehydratase [Prevotella sp.]